jgi:peptide/nickel transport system substrate-binding protein
MPDKQSSWRRLQNVKARRRVITKTAKKAEGATLRHAHRFLVKRWDNVRGVRRRILTWMIGVALLIVIVGIQMVWFQKSYLQTAAVKGGTYAEATQGPVETLNPLYAVSDAELAASRLLFSSLYNYDTTGHLSADIARSMQLDETGKIYTVTMKPNGVWHDGKPVTAKDVVFTVNLMKNPAVRSSMNASWKDITAEVASDYSVKFTLPAAYAAFPQALTFSILPEHILKDIEPRLLRQNAFSTAPVGSGPFVYRLTQSINNADMRKVIHLVSNKNYYAQTPKLDRFQFHVYGKMDDIATALRTGEVGSAADISSDIARSIDRSRYEVMSKPINSGVYAIINTSQPILAEAPVRQALQLATDTSKIRRELYGNPPELELPFVKGQLTGDGVPTRPAYNIEQANELLDKAGWVKSNDGTRKKANQELRLKVVTRKNSDYEKSLEVIAGQWKEIGVAIDKQVVDPSAVDQSFTQTVLQPRNYDVLIDELYIGGDLDVFAYWHSRGLLNFANYSNVTSDDALVSGRASSNAELRSLKYKAFASQWLQDVPAIGLYQSTMIYAQNKQLTSLAEDEKVVSVSERYSDIGHWTAERGSVYKTP